MINTVSSFAQAIHQIDSVMDLSPYYLPTFYSSIKSIEFEPLEFEPIDTGINVTHLYEPLLLPENIYQSLGINGQAHQSIIFDYQREMGFLYQEFPYPLYFKTHSNLIFPKLQTTYSKIAYTYGLLDVNENQFYATFAQYIKRVTINANLYATRNVGAFVNQKYTTNICGDFLLHYETPSNIYGFKASIIINHLKNAENGGLKDMNAYQERVEQNNGAYSVLLPNARSSITALDVALQNYINIKNKNNRYFGTFTYDFQCNQTTLTYNDKDFDTIPYYECYDTLRVTNDSTRFFTLTNAFQWSNFMPYKEMSNKNNFFHIAGGILHSYADFKYTNATFNSLYLFARTHIRLFRLMDITAKISYAIYGYAENDASANVAISWSLNREKDHNIGLNANFYRNAPEYIMQHVTSNHFRWDTTFAKQNIVQLKAFWNYKKYNCALSYYYINKLVYLSEELRPIQDLNIGNLIQISTFIPYRYKNFGSIANLNLQYCNNDVINVPLFAGKLSVYYIFELLKKRLKILIGTDLMYNTSYYADGYLPALHTFHFQNSQSVGNFVFWDLNVTFQIDRINFFFRTGNLLPPFMYYRNFTTPNYPVKDYLINLGITWKFFD
ncbi:MAG: putative porin [Bacteroidetes bacterium]|nr:putative porin [Bacteroidota bacterium]